MSRPGDEDDSNRNRANQADGVDAARFVRGLTIGLLVGAAIAGSALWRRLGTLRKPT
jgi:hypothetical protein